MDFYVAVRIVGLFGLVTALFTTLRLTLELAPPENPNRLTQLLQTDLEDMWNFNTSRKKTSNVTDVDLVISFILFNLFTAVCNSLLILASYVKKRWGLVLWMMFETLRFMWQVNYLVTGPYPSRYTPGAMEFFTTSLNIAMGLYLLRQTTFPVSNDSNS